MRKPNFFILGAPKSGTTSLASWLAEHPKIYMSPKKEPFHFNTDHSLCEADRLRYELLFASATNKHIAIGEATSMYLYSDVAVSNILQYVEQPSFIVCVRDPVDMAHAFHSELLYQGLENIGDFASAWRLSDLRMRGMHISRQNREPKYLAYNRVCLLGAQVERLLNGVSRNSVHFVVLDDMAANARSEYLKILHFLGVLDDGRMQFPILNRAKTQRLPLISRAFRVAHRIRRSLGIHRQFNLGIQKTIEAYNRVEQKRAEMPPELRYELKLYFHHDVIKLEKLVGRDLSSWLR